MDMASRTRKCRCGHTWDDHDILENRAGEKLVVCMHFDPAFTAGATSVGSICDCKDYVEEEDRDVQVSSAS